MIRPGAAQSKTRSWPPIWRALALAVLVLLVAGCAPGTDREARIEGIGTPRAAPDPPPVPHFSGDRFVTADGTVLPLRRWLPKGRIKAVILGLHGFNDYSHAFAMPAKLWAKDGIATYAYDQRGFGAAPGRGRWPGRSVLAADAVTAGEILRRRYPNIPLYLLGESMGGAVAVVAMTGGAGLPPPKVNGVILVSPAVWGRSVMGLVPKLALWVAVRLFPSMKLTGRGLHIWASDNIPMLRALGRDPLVIKRTRVDAIWGLVNLMSAALRAAPRLDGPLFVMYGAHDELIPKIAIRRFVGGLPRDPRDSLTLAYYAHGYHMLLRDIEAPLVDRDVAHWMLAPGTPLPSGADRAALAFFRAVRPAVEANAACVRKRCAVSEASARPQHP